MKKFFVLSSQAILLTGAISLGTFSLSSCSVETWKTNIQMVVSPAGSKLADRSFLQNSFNGIVDFFKKVRYKDQKFIEPIPENNIEKVGGIWRRSIGADAMRFIESYRDAHASGASTLVCTGFDQAEPLQQFTSDDPNVKNHFPRWVEQLRNKLGFVYADGILDKNRCAPFNVASVAYEADQAGVMAGVLTGIVLNIDSYYSPLKVDFNEKKYADLKIHLARDTQSWYNGPVFKIGSYLGLPGQSTLTFLNGWFQGANYFNEHSQELKTKVKSLIRDLKDRDWYPLTVIEPEDSDYMNFNVDRINAGGFSPSEPRAKVIANLLAKNGAAAILPCGPQDSMIVSEMVQSKQHVAIIGCDVTMEDDNSINQYVNDSGVNRSVIPFSITKNLTGSIFAILQAINESLINNNPEAMDHTNSYHGFGYNNWGTLANGGVAVSHGMIYYDSNNGTKKVAENDGPNSLCNQLVNQIRKMMDDEHKEKNFTEKVYYESLTGDEFNQVRVAAFNSANSNSKTSVITVPKISESAKGNNVYKVPDINESKKPLTDLNRIKSFIQSLYEEIGKVKINATYIPDWYMTRR